MVLVCLGLFSAVMGIYGLLGDFLGWDWAKGSMIAFFYLLLIK